MKAAFLISFLFAIASWGQSSEFPIDRLKGTYFYNEHFEINNVRRAETVTETTAEGVKRVKELRAQGYSCIRKNEQTRLCSKNWKPTEVPEGFDQSVAKFMKGIQVEFEGGENPPVLIHDGSTTQEWEVSEQVKIIETQISIYRVVRNHEGEIFIAFPVNENQPMSPLRYHNKSKLGMTMVGQSKDTPTSTVAYTIEAFLENSH